MSTWIIYSMKMSITVIQMVLGSWSDWRHPLRFPLLTDQANIAGVLIVLLQNRFPRLLYPLWATTLVIPERTSVSFPFSGIDCLILAKMIVSFHPLWHKQCVSDSTRSSSSLFPFTKNWCFLTVPRSLRTRSSSTGNWILDPWVHSPPQTAACNVRQRIPYRFDVLQWKNSFIHSYCKTDVGGQCFCVLLLSKGE